MAEKDFIVKNNLTIGVGGSNTTSILLANTATANVFNTISTTINAFGAATTLTLGYSGTAASTTNISTGAVAASTTKTINIGTGGAASSTTNIDIGTTVGGTIQLMAPNSYINGTLVSIDNVTTLNIGTQPTGQQTLAIGTSTTASGSTKTISIGNNGASGSTATVNIGNSINGTGTISIGANGTSTSISIGTGGSSPTVNIGTGAATNSTINIGTTALGLTSILSTAVTLSGATLNINGANPTIATTSTGTASVFTTNALIGNIFAAATTITIGATTGTTTIRNATITLSNATTLNINGASPSISTSSTGTASIFNATALTGNIFGAATTINIGNTVTSAQTVNIGAASTGASTYNIGTGATANATTKTINIGTGGVSGSTTNIAIGSSSGGTTTVNSNLTVTGNLTINGTTSTVNSTTVTVDDPIITLGGDTAPTSDDNKDRGVEFRWHNGTIAKVGFFGYDDSSGKFTFIPDATNTSEVFSGTLGTVDVGAVHINGSQISAANLSNGTTGDSGTAVVLATSPTLVTPILGTPQSGNFSTGTFTWPTFNQNTTGSAGSVANSLTISSPLSGTSYNGSSAVTIALASGYGDTQNPYASKTANYVLASPDGISGVPTFRALTASDIPTLNQNTTGSAGSVANSLTISSPLSGTSYNGSSAVTIALASGYGDTQNPYASKTANFVLAAPNGLAGVPTFRALVAADIPTLNQTTTGSAASLSVSGQTGLLTFTGLTTVNRAKTVRDAADTILELGGSYTPTGTWVWTSATATWPTFNQNTTGSAGSVTNALTVGNGLQLDSGTTYNGSAARTISTKAIGCKLEKAVAQTLTTSTNTAITFGASDTEVFDTDNFHSTSTNTSRITIPAGLGGKYIVTASAGFAANATGARYVAIYKNGALDAGNRVPANAVSLSISELSTSAILSLAATDYVEMYCFQSSGGNLDVVAGTYTSLSVAFLGA